MPHDTIETVFHAYCFDVSKPEGKEAYANLCATMKAQGVRRMQAWAPDSSFYKPALDGRTISLETKHLFDNQWNTAPIEGVSDKGLRVFDWAQDYPGGDVGSPRFIRRGHWLEQTTEMREVRRNTYVCGYCGKQEPAAKGDVFCPRCIDSPYLKESELHLLRMQPVSETRDRAKLTDAESAQLVPLYRAAQIHGATERGKARALKARQDVAATYAKEVKHATMKRDGYTWILDNLGNTENVLFYNHTETFSFGWRQPLDAGVLSVLLDKITDFPFRYEIKCADGRTLTGER